MFEKKEGFTEILIPEQRFKSCSGCKFYIHQMLKSGNNPIYSKNCIHPNTEIEFSDIFGSGNLSETNSGFIITPNWCSFLK